MTGQHRPRGCLVRNLGWCQSSNCSPTQFSPDFLSSQSTLTGAGLRSGEGSGSGGHLAISYCAALQLRCLQPNIKRPFRSSPLQVLSRYTDGFTTSARQFSKKMRLKLFKDWNERQFGCKQIPCSGRSGSVRRTDHKEGVQQSDCHPN